MANWLAKGVGAILAAGAVALLVFGSKPGEMNIDGKPVRGRVVVTYWEKWTAEEARTMQSVVDDFNRSQDRIFVNYVSMARVNEKMLIATAGGDPPDIAGVWAYQMGAFVSYGALRPLDELQRDGTIGPDTYKPFIWKVCAPDGKRAYAVSSTPASLALFWNKKLFREAGLDPEKPPTTIEELDTFSAKLDKIERDDLGRTRVRRAGFLPPYPGSWDHLWGAYWGAPLWDQQQDRIIFNDEPSIAAYTWFQNYARKLDFAAVQGFRESFGRASASAENPFMSEKIAMIMQGPWFSNFIRLYRPDLVGQYGVAPFPSPAGVVLGDLDIWVIPTGAKHPQEAMEALRFFTRQENMERLCIGHCKPSPLMKVSDAFFREHARVGNPYVRVFDDLMRKITCISQPISPVWEICANELTPIAKDRIWRGADIRTSLNDAQAAADKHMAEFKQMQRRRAAAEGGGR